jgi:hypothetical protein
MMSKTEDWSTPGPFRGNSRGLGKAAADMGKRFRMIRVPRRAWLVALGLATVPLMSSVAFATQSLTDRQMDTVTAGLGNNLIAVAKASAVALGNLDSETATLTVTITDQGRNEPVTSLPSLALVVSPAASMQVFKWPF